MPKGISTEDLNLAYRVLDVMADEMQGDLIAACLLRAAAEVLRVALRSRTIHDPLPGQATLPDL